MRNHINRAWLNHASMILAAGDHVKPRGKNTLEIPHKCIDVDMRTPVMTFPDRKLNYKFMCAEAFWILSGDDRVETIAPYNKNISQFSDDGVRFFGAYGPKVVDQMNYVVSKLASDLDSRQAVINIWRENPQSTRDYPCTLNMTFMVRDGKLNTHVFMRSSDAYLGIPYDVFTFSMVTHLICGFLNQRISAYRSPVSPGTLYLTAASAHIYEENFQNCRDLIDKYINIQPMRESITPELWFHSPDTLMAQLKQLREEGPGSPLRWWEK
jgi:thymidylate synthase